MTTTSDRQDVQSTSHPVATAVEDDPKLAVAKHFDDVLKKRRKRLTVLVFTLSLINFGMVVLRFLYRFNDLEEFATIIVFNFSEEGVLVGNETLNSVAEGINSITTMGIALTIPCLGLVFTLNQSECLLLVSSYSTIITGLINFGLQSYRLLISGFFENIFTEFPLCQVGDQCFTNFLVIDYVWDVLNVFAGIVGFQLLKTMEKLKLVLEDEEEPVSMAEANLLEEAEVVGDDELEGPSISPTIQLQRLIPTVSRSENQPPLQASSPLDEPEVRFLADDGEGVTGFYIEVDTIADPGRTSN